MYNPTTNIRIIKGYPCDADYQHTMFFGSVKEQHDYMTSLAKYTLYNYTYQRVTSNRIRIEKNYYELYDCNYLMFQNEHFGSKWFYAFITNLEYINEVTTEITYQIDVMQTWHFEYELQDCFVEREHVADDTVGLHTVPENVNMGPDYLFLNTRGSHVINNNEQTYVIACTFKIKSYTEGQGVIGLPDYEFEDWHGATYSGMFSGLHYICIDGEDNMKGFIQAVVSQQKSEGIIALWQVPSAFLVEGTGILAGHHVVGSKPKQASITIPKYQSTLGTYTPRNKKLLTAPYNLMYVTNKNGQTAEFAYENFVGDADFKMIFAMSNTPSVALIPVHYLDNGSAPETYGNTDQMLTLSAWQPCSFITDYYSAWLAQNGTSMAVSAVSSLAGSASLFAAGTVAGAVGVTTSLVTQATNALIETSKAKAQPDQVRGNTGVSVTQAAGLNDFLFGQKCIKPEYAKIIDSYFDEFGYKVSVVKKPNRDVRERWCYCKTIGCNVTGDLPGADIAKINSIYNSGITFWKSSATVGDYSKSNKPV